MHCQRKLTSESFITKFAGKLFLFVKISKVFIEDILFLSSKVALGTGKGKIVTLQIIVYVMFGLPMSLEVLHVSAGHVTKITSQVRRIADVGG